MAKRITPRSMSYSDWYTDIVVQAKLADYSPVRGCMVIRPAGYALWERMQAAIDAMFKASGHLNAYFPLLIPQSFIQKEAQHVEGFAPEMAVVTHGGGEALEEPLVVRPTSETMIWSMYKRWIQSYRDLPLLINQWANVMRWEKRTRLFLRTSEFLWQEGHTAHETEAEAREETLRMLEIYRSFAQDYMALPVLTGSKSESEKFAGAVDTYAIEALMQDGKSLQAGTSHFLGQNFARAFDVQFQTRDSTIEHVWATSWGVSTRLVGALIMAHSDDRGLVVPPRLAQFQVVVVPIMKAATRATVLPVAERIHAALSKQLRSTLDRDESNSPGWRFAEWELRGVPVRVEVGPRDIQTDQVTLVRRDSGEKTSCPIAEVADRVRALLDDIQAKLYRRALTFRDDRTLETDRFDAMREFIEDGGGFVIAPWDGDPKTEAEIKTQLKTTIRVLPFDRQHEAPGRTSILSGAPARHVAVFAKAY